MLLNDGLQHRTWSSFVLFLKCTFEYTTVVMDTIKGMYNNNTNEMVMRISFYYLLKII